MTDQDAPNHNDDVVASVEHLALVLGGSGDSFTGDLLRLIAKAQATPANFVALRHGFPRQVLAWEIWTLLAQPTEARLRRAIDHVWSGNGAFLRAFDRPTARLVIAAILVVELGEELTDGPLSGLADDR